MNRRMVKGMQALGLRLVRQRGSHLIYLVGNRPYPVPQDADPARQDGLNVIAGLVRLGVDKTEARRAFGLRVD